MKPRLSIAGHGAHRPGPQDALTREDAARHDGARRSADVEDLKCIGRPIDPGERRGEVARVGGHITKAVHRAQRADTDRVARIEDVDHVQTGQGGREPVTNGRVAFMVRLQEMRTRILSAHGNGLSGFLRTTG